MRKELVVFLPTTEKGVEVSLRISRDGGILITHETAKFAVPIGELTQAIVELESFASSNKQVVVNDLVEHDNFNAEYEEEDAQIN